MFAGKDTLAGGQASIFCSDPVYRLPFYYKKKGDWRSEDTRYQWDRHFGEQQRNPPKKETDFWVALGARVRLHPRNLQITRHRHPSIQANTGLLRYTQNCLPCKSEKTVGTKMVSWAQTHSWHSVGAGQGSKIWNWGTCQCTFLTRLTWLWVPEWWAGDAQ